MAKTVNATKIRRDEVLKLLCKGYTSGTITERIRDKYGVSKKSVELDITKAYQSIRDKYDMNTETIVKTHLAKYDQIIEDCTDMYDQANKIKAMNAKEKLLKLHSPETAIQINNNSLEVNVKDYSLEELKQLLKGED